MTPAGKPTQGANLDPNEFAQRWVSSFNRGDMAAIMAHYHPDVEFTSPIAQLLKASTDGTLRGVAALEAYLRRGLELVGSVHFEVVGVTVGIGGISIVYRNQWDQLVTEVMMLEDNLVRRAWVAYTPRP